MKKILFVIIFVLAGLNFAYAVPAYPHPIQVTQPDGTVLTIRVHGDEYLNWTTCGNSLVVKGSDGYYHYASFGANGVSQTQGGIVRANLSGDGASVKPPKAMVEKAMQERQRAAQDKQPSRSAGAVSGNGPFLVLLIQFSDLEFSNTMTAQTAFSNMLNQSGYSDNGGTGSVKDYYSGNSHEVFQPNFDVFGPITVNGTMSSYSSDDYGRTQNGAPRLLAEACSIADSQVDFSKYDLDNDGYIDNIFFYFAGYNAAEGVSGTIWPHAWWVYYDNFTFDGKKLYSYSCSSELKGTSGNTMSGIGTFCHEFGHTIGLPDFYDTDYADNGEGKGLDVFSLMSSGNYNNGGKTPPYLTYEERHILGWDDGLTLLSEGSNTLSPISANKAYYCPTGHDNEYYLFESRPAKGWDLYTYGDGMVVYHIDKSDFVLPDGTTAASKWSSGYEINIFEDHQCMDLVETVPESQIQYYEQFVFPGSEKVTQFNGTTSPAFVAWNGVSTGYSLSNITFNSADGTTSFTVATQRQLGGQVLTTDGLPVAGAQVTVTPVDVLKSQVQSTSGMQLMMCAPVQKTPAAELKAVTDAEGRFVVYPDAGGDFMVNVRKDSYYVPYSSAVTLDGVSVNLNICLVTPQEGASNELKKYSGGYNGNSVGTGVSGDYYAGVKFADTELSGYVGSNIKSISFVASNGGNGTVDEMGVMVYFGDDVVLSRKLNNPIFGTNVTIDISDAGLKIPDGNSVTFSYYILNSSYGWPIAYTGQGTGDNAALFKTGLNQSWWDLAADYPQFNYFIISAGIMNGGKIISLSGINTIATQSSYTAGTPFNLTLNESTVNPPSGVTWKVDGVDKDPTGVTLSAGTHTVRANVTYASGRTEVIETKIQVK